MYANPQNTYRLAKQYKSHVLTNQFLHMVSEDKENRQSFGLITNKQIRAV